MKNNNDPVEQAREALVLSLREDLRACTERERHARADGAVAAANRFAADVAALGEAISKLELAWDIPA